MVPEPNVSERLQAMLQQVQAIPDPEDALETVTLSLLKVQALQIIKFAESPDGLAGKNDVIKTNMAIIERLEAELGPGHEGVVLLKRMFNLAISLLTNESPP